MRVQPASRSTPRSEDGRQPRPLPRSFYERGAEELAEALLGCLLVRRLGDELLSGRIVETEAYVGEEDRACHAHAGRTKRNEVMYGDPGHVYVYFIYGMYDMMNVVCQPAGWPEAVLLRALEPLRGIETMGRLRRVHQDRELANGPGKLCRALAIGRSLNGADLLGPELWITRGRLRPGERVVRGARVGVDYAGPDALRPLRFYLDGHPHVSRAASRGRVVTSASRARDRAGGVGGRRQRRRRVPPRKAAPRAT